MINFDVVIIGSGLAGLSTALKLADNKRIAIISKRALDDSSSQWALSPQKPYPLVVLPRFSGLLHGVPKAYPKSPPRKRVDSSNLTFGIPCRFSH